MPIPDQFRNDADTLSAGLRRLLEDELTAGNSIAAVGYTFPVHGIGVWFRLSGPVTTRPRESGAGLTFILRNNSDYSGSFEEQDGNQFILEPPLPPEPIPDMDAIREAHAPKASTPPPIQSDPNTLVGRFERSMVMDYMKWHDG